MSLLYKRIYGEKALNQLLHRGQRVNAEAIRSVYAATRFQ